MRVSVVSGICVGKDAISESVRGSIEAIQSGLGADVRLFTYANEFPTIDSTIVQGVGDILLDKFYLGSDVILYHFGVYYDLFNAILLGNGHARQIVYYHNVTPKEFLPQSEHALVERSLRQLANIDSADTVLAASVYSARGLEQFGIPASRISVCPLYLKFATAPNSRQAVRSPGSVELLFVGRVVQSKGVLDLVEAAAGLHRAGIPFKLRLAGNQAFSDAAYVKTVMEAVAAFDMETEVVFVGQVSEAELQNLYAAADIFVMPSYHEGFCVPIVEALSAGCVPLAYASGNLPDLVGQYGRLVKTGDVEALTAGLTDLARQFASGSPTIDLGWGPLAWDRYRASVRQLLQRFTFEAFAETIVEKVRPMVVAS